MSAEPTVTMIVCTLDRPAAITALLAALSAQTRRPDAVLVVDASADVRTEVVVRADPSARYRRATTGERGLTRQRNIGIAETAGDLVAFLDDDTVPEPTYVAELVACFARHPDAVGVGGYLTEVAWQPASIAPARGVFRSGDHQRREDLRWRLRRRLGLDSPAPPGIMPPSGHPRPLGFVPPDGADHRVDFVMGGAACWRRSLFEQVIFDPELEGYGLYEDLDFSLRAGQSGALYLATRARVAHEHAPAGRPRQVRYGRMVVENGWHVWRSRWPRPGSADRLRWWATTLLLTGCRAGDVLRGGGRAALGDTWGRVLGMAAVLAGRRRRPR